MQCQVQTCTLNKSHFCNYCQAQYCRKHSIGRDQEQKSSWGHSCPYWNEMTRKFQAYMDSSPKTRKRGSESASKESVKPKEMEGSIRAGPRGDLT